MSPISTQGEPTTFIARTTVQWNRSLSFVSNKLGWGHIYRTTSYLKSALWTVPLVAIALCAYGLRLRYTCLSSPIMNRRTGRSRTPATSRRVL
jgi:hypothetical protein